jgi:hypothetical protein
VARLRSILKGTRQIFTVEVALKNMVPQEGLPDKFSVGLTLVLDWGPILKGATKYALENGGKAEDGSELYDYGKALYTLAVACVDPDSDPAKPSPFFGESDNPTLDERVFDMCNNPNIGRDTILFLAEAQDLWQDECGCQGDGKRERTPEEYAQMLAEVAEEGPLAYLRLSAGTRFKLVRFTANLLLTSLRHSETSGSSSTVTQ